jgi:hypothetical protein
VMAEYHIGSGSFDPGQVMSEVEEGAARLEKAADVYSKAVLRFETAEEAYELEMAKARLRADGQGAGGKLPSQDRRQDQALRYVHDLHADTYVEYFAAKADKEAQAVLYRALSASVSARQSLLKALSGS